MSLQDSGAANYAHGSANLEARASIWSHAVPIPGAAPAPLGWFCDVVDWDGVQLTADIGCGSGRYLPAVSDRSQAAIGLDYSVGMLDEVRQRSTVPLIAGDVCRLPLQDGIVDRVLAAWMLYHAADTHAACAELRRVLRPDGVLIAVTNAAGHTAELDTHWDAAMARLGQAGGSRPRLPMNGFALDEAADTLSRHFGSVDMHIRRTCLHVPDPAPVITYLSSLRDYLDAAVVDRGLGFDDVTLALTDVLQAELERAGVIEITGLTAAIVCR